MIIKCEHCDATAVYAVGSRDHVLVCEPCSDWGDSRRWWNLEPRQRIGGDYSLAGMYWLNV